ncbi:MAG: HDOD domain-containing protein [bacterium]
MDRAKRKVIQGVVQNSMVSLPTLAPLAARIIHLAERGETSARELVKLISLDQSLTMRILRVVNSALYGFSNKISSLQHAVMILGFESVKNIVLSTSALISLRDGGALNYRELWKHSIGCAVASKLLAERTGKLNCEEAFTAGLLHDVGKILLNKYVRGMFEEAVHLASRHKISLHEAERNLIGITHGEMGEWLAELWQLPNSLVETISLHHEPEKACIAPELVYTVWLADVVARREGVGGGNPQSSPVSASILDRFRLTPEGLQNVGRALVERMGEIQMLFDF